MHMVFRRFWKEKKKVRNLINNFCIHYRSKWEYFGYSGLNDFICYNECHLFFFLFFNVATGTLKTTYMACLLFLLDNADLEPGYLNVIPGTAAVAPGSLSRMQIHGPLSSSTVAKPTFLTRSPGDSLVRKSFRSSGLAHSLGTWLYC